MNRDVIRKNAELLSSGGFEHMGIRVARTDFPATSGEIHGWEAEIGKETESDSFWVSSTPLNVLWEVLAQQAMERIEAFRNA